MTTFPVPAAPVRIDYRTGEILQGWQYAATPYRPGDDPSLPTFTDIRSVAGLQRFMSHVDRRTLVRVNDCRRLYDLDKGNHHLTGKAIRFPTSQYAKLDRLVQRLDYANSLITRPADLACWLGIPRNLIYRYLADLSPMVQVLGVRDGMARGTLRVNLSPAYGFRYPGGDLALARQDAIAAWYRAVLQ